MDITNFCVSSLEMLLSPFSAAILSYCVFVNLSALSFEFNNWKASSLKSLKHHIIQYINSYLNANATSCCLFPNVAESVTLSGDERELGKVCVRLNYQEALEQVWITLVQVRLHAVWRRGIHGQKALLWSLVAFLNGPSVRPEYSSPLAPLNALLTPAQTLRRKSSSKGTELSWLTLQ